MADCVDNEHCDPTDIIPDSDCILVVGPEKIRIHANSLFLSAASGPFRAIFGPDWKEGHDLRHQADLVEIPLPEDDATAFQRLCAVLHHQNDSIPRKLPALAILSIAVLADKYDCVRAAKFACESWLHSGWDATSDVLVVAAAAYLLRNEIAFRNTTKKLILTHNGPFTAISCAEVEAAMDWRVFSECFPKGT